MQSQAINQIQQKPRRRLITFKEFLASEESKADQDKNSEMTGGKS